MIQQVWSISSWWIPISWDVLEMTGAIVLEAAREKTLTFRYCANDGPNVLCPLSDLSGRMFFFLHRRLHQTLSISSSN